MKQENVRKRSMNMTPQVVWKTKISEQILISLFVTRIHKSLEVTARMDRMLTTDGMSGHGPACWGEHTCLTRPLPFSLCS